MMDNTWIEMNLQMIIMNNMNKWMMQNIQKNNQNNVSTDNYNIGSQSNISTQNDGWTIVIFIASDYIPD